MARGRCTFVHVIGTDLSNNFVGDLCRLVTPGVDTIMNEGNEENNNDNNRGDSRGARCKTTTFLTTSYDDDGSRWRMTNGGGQMV